MKTGKLKTNNGGLAWFFLGPSLLGFALFYLLPFVTGFYYSLVDSPLNGTFVGLHNYGALLKKPSFLAALANTAKFTLICVPLNLMLSLGAAMLLNQKLPGRNLFRTIMITPLVVPVASVVLVWQAFFDLNGVLNSLIHALGHPSVDWMKTNWSRVVVLVIYLWKNIGYSVILFLAGLQNIPAEYYEAARIDGASRYQEFFRITLVYLTPTTFFVFVISMINSFKVFRETYLISGDYPHNSIYMLQHYMNNMFMALDYQKLTSAAFIMAAFIVAVVLLLFIVERKITNMIN
ncbi:binding-protein-dependent transport systems inner membrane component [Desulfitobacterium hafniense DCB-2]|uniref:ABC transporter, permease protein n=2 Tax=Desulfitobacterium hafniense TaxID=49338 RepID=G9XJ08_DESHA|nr:sugar ABC transporter permease [Desulfitobacterium hafniense]ACL19713.1 binding-protein-dependent transport systems inner membrane component [Desulfitobacterium hafniense DCB-2]EHL08292.1 ABC transporter, permease protein [Desulfitobacterium hafniense DP7]